ncbi:uncharacterized protein LOC111676013 [Lucilia cuprina]|uniref:uncharacterized protein LOC111676013 n=1 Tax=Lucilia cuprina TaxID=7375 RepID=UPI001F065562|nr:uncharacterized protein LOC111676013 [Lucilia cuprina]
MTKTIHLPQWLNAELFLSVLEKHVVNFEKIQNFSAKPAFAAGENYLSTLWSIEIEAALKDGSLKTLKYMLKVPPESPQAMAIVTMLNSFKRELIAYYELLPAFEELYKKQDHKIHIAPKAFKFDKDLGMDVILMEDIRVNGFKTMNRLEGLDMEHTKNALQKLAQFHAASAAYIAEKGSLPDLLMKPMINQEMLKMLTQSQKPQEAKLLGNLHLYKAEHLREKIINYQSKYIEQIYESDNASTQNPDGFYIFSHGDCWSNNIMFLHDDKDHISETLFVDFQAGRCVTPALDLQYFLLSCPCLDIKIKYFDHFVQHYHQELVKHLKILNYTKSVPSLTEVHKWMYKTSYMGYTVILKSLPVFLLDPTTTNDISMDNMMGDKSSGSDMQQAMYTNERYAKHLQQILPWMENRGYFEEYMIKNGLGTVQYYLKTLNRMTTNNEEVIENTGFKDIPPWLNEKLFEEFLENDFPNYRKIKDFTVRPAVKTGENYMTVVLRIALNVELYNGTATTTSYMVKIKPIPEKLQFMIKEWKLFDKERITYMKYLRIFENYYQNAGCKIKLAPRLLDPTKCNINDDDVLILEDLRLKGFKNFNRHLGLDLLHTKAVLKKLAQLHAASDNYFIENGPLSTIYDKSLSSDLDLFEDHRKKLGELFRENLDLYGNFKYLEEKLKIFFETKPDPFQLQSDWKTNNFNVLNHGDCWTNNIMFQYDDNDQLNETLFVDFQMSRFGTPAQDLYYLLLSSTNLEVKLKYFDYFIYYYHQQLVEHLKLLNYKGKIPTLKEIHMELLKHDYWAYPTINHLMVILLCESRHDANVDNLINEDNEEFKRSMYKNDLYVKHMNILIPWLDNRGAFDV